MAGLLIALAFGAVAWWAFVRFSVWLRHRSPQARERTAAKADMPGWLKLTEMSLLAIFWLALMFPVISAAFALHAAWHTNAHRPSQVAGFLLTLPCVIATLVPAMLMANLVSWMVSPMRRANERAMEGRPAASFGQSVIDLARVGAVLIPIALAAIAVGVADPWLR